MVELRSINVHYGLLHALSDVDLRVEAGEIVGLLGDTGAGKSTLLKVIAGALEVTRAMSASRRTCRWSTRTSR